MHFMEAVRVALSSLHANKMRTALTLLGMIIGVFAIVTSVTAVKVIDVYFQDRMSMLGSNTFTISRDPAINVSGRSNRSRRNLTYEQVQRLEETMQKPVFISVRTNFGSENER